MAAVKAAILLKLTGWNLMRAVAMRSRKEAQAKLAINTLEEFG